MILYKVCAFDADMSSFFSLIKQYMYIELYNFMGRQEVCYIVLGINLWYLSRSTIIRKV
jgi:hypothetical protein